MEIILYCRLFLNKSPTGNRQGLCLIFVQTIVLSRQKTESFLKGYSFSFPAVEILKGT